MGAFLRKEGVHQAQLDEWRAAAEQALDVTVAAKAEATHAQELAALRKELARKDKALAEAAARLVLRKKLEALWGDEDDDTTPPSEAELLAAVVEAVRDDIRRLREAAPAAAAPWRWFTTLSSASRMRNGAVEL